MRRFLPGEKAEVLSRCLPGQRVAAYFNDERMYHERILLWKSDGMKWAILTPDDDVYLEDFSGYGDPGCDSFKVKGEHFTYWSRVGGAAYRFSQEISDDILREKIGEALECLGGEVHGPQAWRPSGIQLQDGSIADTSVFLGRLLVPRRLTGKGPGLRPGNDATGPAALPSAVGAVQPAPEGFVWVAAEPLEGLVLGQEVSITPSTDVQLGSRTAMLKRGQQWVKAELVKLEDCADFADRRRSLFGQVTVPGPPTTDRTRALDLVAEEAPKARAEDEIRTLYVDGSRGGGTSAKSRSLLSWTTSR